MRKRNVRSLVVIRFAPILMACALALPCVVHAQFSYITENGAITITEYTGAGGDVTIPSALNNLPVKAIRYPGFYNCTSLKTVVIPNSVTTIGDSTFTGCTSLTSVTIPNSVTSIDDWTFKNCTSLPGISIPSSITAIGDAAFQGCSGLTNVTIPNSVKTLGTAVFRGCWNLQRVVIGNGVNIIPPLAFYACDSLTDVAFGTSVREIDVRAFSDCRSLTQLVLPDSLITTWSRAFQYCTSLTNVVIGSSFERFGQSLTFFNCYNLKSVFFKGDAPNQEDDDMYDEDDFFLGASEVTIYYLPGTTGWGPIFAHVPTAVWSQQQPAGIAGVGMQATNFGFKITGSVGQKVVVEASTSLVAPSWSAISTNTLVTGSLDFRDPEWQTRPNRFYRIRSE